MFYEYEEYLSEPSEVDKIIEEMKDKLHGLITDEAKDMMEDYRNAKEEICVLNREVSRKKIEINTLQQKINELETQYEQIDKYKMPKKYIDSFVRDVTGYFAPGDKVFIIDNKSKRIQCDKCKGEKKVKAIIEGEENTIECPKCRGYGAVSEYSKAIEEKTIDDVHLTLCFKKDRVGVWTSDSVYVRGQEYAVNPNKIYKTYEEAEKSLKEIE